MPIHKLTISHHSQGIEKSSAPVSRSDPLGALTGMATFQDGNVRRATANTVTAMKRSAERRQCPSCGRKSAMVRNDLGRWCRWCGEGSLDDPADA